MSEWKFQLICVGAILCGIGFLVGWGLVIMNILRMLGIIH